MVRFMEARRRGLPADRKQPEDGSRPIGCRTKLFNPFISHTQGDFPNAAHAEHAVWMSDANACCFAERAITARRICGPTIDEREADERVLAGCASTAMAVSCRDEPTLYGDSNGRIACMQARRRAGATRPSSISSVRGRRRRNGVVRE